MWIDERGQSGDLAGLIVRCGCGNQRGLGDAVDKGKFPLGTCGGQRPWLGRHAKEDCNLPSSLLIRTASNSYFTQIVRVRSIPHAERPIDRAVDESWEIVKDIASIEHLKGASFMSKIRSLRQAFPDEDSLKAVQARQAGVTDSRSAKQVELEAFLQAPEGYNEEIPVNLDFHARALPQIDWCKSEVSEPIDTVIQLHRLREVSALAGFTRLEGAVPDIDGEYDTDVTRADLDENPSWFPAVETRGEGIFIALRPEAVRRWLARPEVKARIAKASTGRDEWLARRKREKPAFPGGPYILLHTLSHLLVQAVSLRCGYPATSIRERVYLDAPGGRYGLLLYTASADAEGTLGGLVQQAHHLDESLVQSLKMAAFCSSAPICAQHAPTETPDERWLHGAACHNCSLIAETSCEMRNEYLDRALVVPTLAVHDAAFFELPQ